MEAQPRGEPDTSEESNAPRRGLLKRLTSGLFSEIAKLFGTYQHWLPGK
jgi:hypothetical protein